MIAKVRLANYIFIFEAFSIVIHKLRNWKKCYIVILVKIDKNS